MAIIKISDTEYQETTTSTRVITLAEIQSRIDSLQSEMVSRQAVLDKLILKRDTMLSIKDIEVK